MYEVVLVTSTVEGEIMYLALDIMFSCSPCRYQTRFEGTQPQHKLRRTEARSMSTAIRGGQRQDSHVDRWLS